MSEASTGPKTATTTKSDTTTKEKKPATKDKKSDGTADKKKAEKKEPEVATHEGQKRVTDDYRAGWARIWKKKG